MVIHAEADHSVWVSAEAETKEQAKALAIEKWNRRHYPPEVQKAVEISNAIQHCGKCGQAHLLDWDEYGRIDTALQNP